MHKKKYFVWAMLVLLVISVALSGCSSNSSGSSGSENASEDGNSNGPVTLKLWGGVPPEAGPQDVVDNWNAENDRIKVEYVRYVLDDAGNLQLDTALMTGQEVDMYINYDPPRFQKRIEAGYALDLGQFDDYDIEAKMGALAEDWKFDGKYYAVPTKRGNTFMWINKDILDEAGLPVPDVDWTWEDLREYAKVMSEYTEWGFVQSITAQELDYVIDGAIVAEGYANEDGTSNLDHPEAIKFFEILYKMMHEDKSTPSYGEQLASKLAPEQVFFSGEAGMFLSGDWTFRTANNMEEYPRDFTTAFAPLPRISEEQDNLDYKRPGGLSDAISINPNSEHVEEAWEFIKWYSDGGMLPQLKGGRIPASVDAVNDVDEALKIIMDGNDDSYDVNALKTTLFDNNLEVFTPSLDQRIVDRRREEYQKYFTDQQSLEDMIDNIVNYHEDYLNEGN